MSNTPKRKPVTKYDDIVADEEHFSAPTFTGNQEDNQEEVETIEIFSIGENKFYAPVKIPATVALRALRTARRHGWEAATYEMLEETVGQETIDALYDCPDATQEQIEYILNKLSAMYFGQMEKMAGKSRNGFVKSHG